MRLHQKHNAPVSLAEMEEETNIVSKTDEQTAEIQKSFAALLGEAVTALSFQNIRIDELETQLNIPKDKFRECTYELTKRLSDEIKNIKKDSEIAQTETEL